MTRSLTPLALLGPYLRPHLGRLLAALAALLLAAGLVLLLGQGVARLIDEGLSAGSAPGLNNAAAFMAGVIALLALATALRFYLVTWLGERVAADLRAALYARVLDLSRADVETAAPGDLLSRMTNDVALLQALVGSAVSMGLRAALTAAGALVLLVLTSTKLALVVVAILPLVVGPLILFARRERRLSRAAQDRLADLAARAEEGLNALATVQAYGQEAAERRRFGAEVEQAVAAARRRIRNRATVLLLAILLGFGAITLALYVGAQDVIAGRMSGGQLSAFVFYAVLLASSGGTLSEIWGEVQRAAAAADRILEVLGRAPSLASPAAPAILPPPRGRIAFEGVRFRYPTRPESLALDGFDLRVAPGETVALVGPSGAGKSTVLQLLLRFYDPEAGRVTLEGMDIREASLSALRARFAYVPQEPVIFRASAAENIRYGRPEASDAEVEAAARAAAAHGFISALPQGYASPLGPRGVLLSGGQRQRIALARAILRDAPILLLDEATSALDAESEQAVQQGLERLSAGRTTLVVAHRLATIRRADRIVVMEAGRVLAEGTHEGLVAEGGLYARLAALQFRDPAPAG
ncbi:ABC transporter transmembrane domain-containing protein [Rubritepida flocculans]|uniref:ABC transporter transmembrane domain-containing protein n=1 Tax=Rubritepida flocculans TaxID=182403 RepID=UPI0003FB6044|nr:ABC transporter transmembrane domain-containing protein [Rubritepida flocculans]